jgi:hypothetical protein
MGSGLYHFLNLFVFAFLGLLTRFDLAQLVLEVLDFKLELLFVATDLVLLGPKHHQRLQVLLIAVGCPALLFLGLVLELLLGLLCVPLLSLDLGLGHLIEADLVGVDETVRVAFLLILVLLGFLFRRYFNIFFPFFDLLLAFGWLSNLLRLFLLGVLFVFEFDLFSIAPIYNAFFRFLLLFFFFFILLYLDFLRTFLFAFFVLFVLINNFNFILAVNFDLLVVLTLLTIFLTLLF